MINSSFTRESESVTLACTHSHRHIMTCCVTVSVVMSCSVVWGNLWSRDCDISTEWRKNVFHLMPSRLLNSSRPMRTPPQPQWSGSALAAAVWSCFCGSQSQFLSPEQRLIEYIKINYISWSIKSPNNRNNFTGTFYLHFNTCPLKASQRETAQLRRFSFPGPGYTYANISEASNLCK